MRFGKKLLAAIERGEWVRRRGWERWHRIRAGENGFFVDERGFVESLVPADVISTDWVIVRKKSKAPKTCVADGRRYEPIETMPVVGDRIEHPDNAGRADAESLWRTVEKLLDPDTTTRWYVEAGGGTSTLDKYGYGWRILKRRNVFTDPKPGDVIGRDHLTMEVRFVDAETVLFRWNSSSFGAFSRETWAALATVGWTVRKLGS